MKTALIIGSTSGIGKQIGLDLLKKDYYVIFNGRNKEKAQELKQELTRWGFKGYNYHIRIEDMGKINNVIVYGEQELDRNIDVLVWCAGTTDRTPFGGIKKEVWREVFEASVDAPFFFIQSIRNKINEDGKIILMSSVLGIEPKSRSISYGVSRAAMNMMVPYLAKENAEKKITVNAIAAGFLDTTWHSSKTTEQIEQIKNECLAKRLGTTEEIAKVALMIIDNDYINGQVIRVDGGYNLYK